MHNPQFLTTSKWYRKAGSYYTQARGSIQRFVCKACGKTFSAQFFSIHYWTKLNLDCAEIAELINGSRSLLQYCRKQKVSYHALENRSRRIGRNALYIIHLANKNLELKESLVFDGFETFCRSQMFPCHFNILTGQYSQFIYGFNYSKLRRKGRMTKQQRGWREKIEEHYRPDPSSIKKQIQGLFTDFRQPIIQACKREKQSLFSDKHRAYPGALKSVEGFSELLESGRLLHIRHDSSKFRGTRNPLFAVNYVDREIRKNVGEHCRESTKYGREVNCQLERMAIFQLMHNFFTPHRIRQESATNPYEVRMQMRGGQECLPEEIGEVFQQRFLYSHLHLYGPVPQWIHDIWQREYSNPPAVDMETGEISSAVTGTAKLSGIMYA